MIYDMRGVIVLFSIIGLSAWITLSCYFATEERLHPISAILWPLWVPIWIAMIGVPRFTRWVVRQIHPTAMAMINDAKRLRP